MSNLTVEAQTAQLEKVLAFVQKEMADCGFTTQQQEKMALCVEEIFVNIAHYAYLPLQGQAKITTEFVRESGLFSVIFADSGKPYNPLARHDPDIHAPAKARAPGGLGVFLVKKLADEVHYEFKNGQNILEILLQKNNC